MTLSEMRVDDLQESDLTPQSAFNSQTALFSTYAAASAYEDLGFSFEAFAETFDYAKVAEIDKEILVMDPDSDILGLTSTIIVDLQAYVYKRWIQIGDEAGWHILIAFRGTAGEVDVLTDAQATHTTFSNDPLTTVHRGFWASMDVFQEEILEDATYTEIFQEPTTRFLIVGHSLGGAIAELYAAKLINEGQATKEQISVYTIGQPAVGDPEFGTVYKDAFFHHRMYHEDDPILFTATESTVYLDSGIMVGEGGDDLGDGHSSLIYIQNLESIEEGTQDFIDLR